MAMSGGHFGAALRRIERLFATGTVAGLSEGQLIERFATRRDEAAFEALVARHGPMVLGICRRVLRDPADVEDAFQATFLVLVRKAGTLRDRDLVGNWLFGVATRVALRSRAVAARRRAVEGSAAAVEPLADQGQGHGHESWAWLHEEVRRLPDKYRVPVVLCYLEGLTHEETARQLGWPVGTVKGRLARARDLLHGRLTRRGMALSSSTLVVALTRDAQAAVSPALVASTVNAALSVAAGRTLAAGVVAANAAALMEEVLNAMFWTQLKAGAVTVLVAGLVTIGAGGLAYRALGESGGPPSDTVGKPAGGGRPAPAAKAGGPASGLSDVEFSTLVRNAGATSSNLLEAARSRGGRFEDLERLIRWSNQELETELVLSGGAAQRRAALSAHADRMKRLHELTQGLAQSDPDQASKADLARTHRQMAERRLAAAEDGDPHPASPLPGTPPLAPSPPIVLGGGVGLASVGGNTPSADARKDPRVPLAARASRMAARDKSPGSRAIMAKLEEPVSMTFANETPLEDVLKYIKSATQGSNEKDVIPIYVDPVGLKEAAVEITAPVTLDLEGVPLKTTLRLLLKQLGLAYIVKDGVLIISSPAALVEELDEAEASSEAGAAAPADQPGPAAPADNRRTPGVPAPPGPRTDDGALKSETPHERRDRIAVPARPPDR